MRVGIVLFPFPFSPSPTSQHPCPPPPQKKTMVASQLDEMEISWPDIENSFQLACFRFISHGSVCALPFWPSGMFWPPAELCFYISASLLWLLPRMPFSYPVYLANPCPFLKIQMKCCLSPYISLHSFPTQFISPTSPPIHNPFTLCYSDCPTFAYHCCPL